MALTIMASQILISLTFLFDFALFSLLFSFYDSASILTSDIYNNGKFPAAYNFWRGSSWH